MHAVGDVGRRPTGAEVETGVHGAGELTQLGFGDAAKGVRAALCGTPGGEGGFVEECSASAYQRGSGTGSVGKGECIGALGALGEFVVSVASEGIDETLAISFVLASRAVLFETFSIEKGVASVALCALIDCIVIDDTWEFG
jgi:hypothetical protein